MKTFFLRMGLLFFLFAAVILLWGAFTLPFYYTIWNILMGVGGIWFLFLFLETIDKLNNYGKYGEQEKQDEPEHHEPPQRPHTPRFGTYNPEDGSEIMEDE